MSSFANAYSERPPIPQDSFIDRVAEERDRLADEGLYVTKTFEGWDLPHAEREHMRDVLSEAYAYPGVREAEQVCELEDGLWLHSVEVAALTVLTLQRMGYDREAQLYGARVAFFHDTGKLAPELEDVRDTRDSFSVDQRARMQRHTVFGARFALGAGAGDKIAFGVLYHHFYINNDVNGGPYPAKDDLPEDVLPLLGISPADQSAVMALQVVAACDHFSAISSRGTGRQYMGSRPIPMPARRLNILRHDLAVDTEVVHHLSRLVGTDSEVA